jgi:CRP-like cAMP-binding protein
MVPYSYDHSFGLGGPEDSSPERSAPRRRGLTRDPFLAVVAVMLGGEALAPVRTRLMKPADVLAEPGEPMRVVYAVLSGRLGLFQSGPASVPGRPRLREVLGPGQRAGEAHLLADRHGPTDFRLQCLSGGLVAVIDAGLYWSWCRRPEVALPVLRELAHQARARERLRLSWLELDMTARLAAVLLDLHERFDDGRVALGLSQSQLGDLIGARRETVNRASRALQAEGLVRGGWTVAGELQDRRAVS